jgi:hypothetical protein
MSVAAARLEARWSRRRLALLAGTGIVAFPFSHGAPSATAAQR